MNRKILFLTLLVALVFIASPLGFASAQLHDYSDGSSVSLVSLVDSLEKIVAYVFSAIAVVCFVMAGIFFLTAQGDATKLSAAKSMVIWGVAGVVVGIIAFSIIAIVSSFLT